MVLFLGLFLVVLKPDPHTNVHHPRVNHTDAESSRLLVGKRDLLCAVVYPVANMFLEKNVHSAVKAKTPAVPSVGDVIISLQIQMLIIIYIR